MTTDSSSGPMCPNGELDINSKGHISHSQWENIFLQYELMDEATSTIIVSIQ